MNDSAEDLSTEQRILAAAKKIFVKQGMAGARMQDIADEAGINKAMLHYYFRSKEKLFDVILKEAIARLLPGLTAIFNGNETLFEKIELFCEQYIGTVMENPYIPLFILNELNRQPQNLASTIFNSERGPALKKLMAQIEDEVKKGTIKPIHPLQLVMNMLSLCIFPFIGKPVLQSVSGMTDEQYLQVMEIRKKEVPQFIIASIKK